MTTKPLPTAIFQNGLSKKNETWCVNRIENEHLWLLKSKNNVPSVVILKGTPYVFGFFYTASAHLFPYYRKTKEVKKKNNCNWLFSKHNLIKNKKLFSGMNVQSYFLVLLSVIVTSPLTDTNITQNSIYNLQPFHNNKIFSFAKVLNW